jgi:non-ribosomal peptide synthetase component F
MKNLFFESAVVECGAQPQNAAFVVFTSGSTGKPKGIVLEHRNISTSIQKHNRPMNITSESRALQLSSFSFDVSIYEIFTTLTMG